MNAKEMFEEVLEKEEESINRIIVVSGKEKEDIKKIEEILQKKGEEEAETLIKQILIQSLRGHSWSVLKWVQGERDAR